MNVRGETEGLWLVVIHKVVSNGWFKYEYFVKKRCVSNFQKIVTHRHIYTFLGQVGHFNLMNIWYNVFKYNGITHYSSQKRKFGLNSSKKKTYIQTQQNTEKKHTQFLQKKDIYIMYNSKKSYCTVQLLRWF